MLQLENFTDLDIETSSSADEHLKAETLFLERVERRILHTVRNKSGDLLREMALDHFSVRGKMLRPKIVFRLARVLGCDHEQLEGCLHWAAALEILHGGSLVHDDLQDGDQVRRKVPTTWAKYGANQAINLGDYLLLVAPHCFLESKISEAHKLKLASLYFEMSAQLVGGQSLEPLLNALQGPPAENLEQEYFRCISMKTAAFFWGLFRGWRP